MLVLGLADYLVTTDTFAMDSQNLDNLHQIGSLQNCMSLILQSRNYLTPVVRQVWSAVKLKYVIRYNYKRYSTKSEVIVDYLESTFIYKIFLPLV